MQQFVCKVVCNITLENKIKEYMHGKEEHAFYTQEEALDFLKKRLSGLGRITAYNYKFTDSEGLPVYAVIHSIHCELVDDLDYANDKEYESNEEEELLNEAREKIKPYKENTSTGSPPREEEPF